MSRSIVGTGEHVYQVIHPLGTVPEGVNFGPVSHVATDSADRVYAFQRRDPPVLVFNSQGEFLTSWGSGLFVDAHGIFITPTDEIFLIDRDAHEVMKFNADGEVLLRMGTRDRPSLQGPFNHPADLAVTANGEIFVADGYGNSRVHRFSAQGRLIKSWGSPGAGPGEFTTPHGIWVDLSGRVCVCDRENNRVQIFDIEGGYVGEWRDLYHPMDIYQDSHGTFFVTDQIPRITMLNAAGELVARGRTPYNSHGIWIDSQGDIYLAGQVEGITKLVKAKG